MNFNIVRDITTTLGWMGFFSAVILSYYFYLRFRNRERMALIEKGVDVSLIFKPGMDKFKFPWLRIAMLMLGAGIGVLIPILLFGFTGSHLFRSDSFPFVIVSSIIIFGAIGIIIGDTLQRHRDSKNG